MGSCPVLPHVMVVLLMRRKGDMHVVLRKPDARVFPFWCGRMML